MPIENWNRRPDSIVIGKVVWDADNIAGLELTRDDIEKLSKNMRQIASDNEAEFFKEFILPKSSSGSPMPKCKPPRSPRYAHLMEQEKKKEELKHAWGKFIAAIEKDIDKHEKTYKLGGCRVEQGCHPGSHPLAWVEDEKIYIITGKHKLCVHKDDAIRLVDDLKKAVGKL